MNIVILADSFPPYICGVTTHTVELSRALIRRGHRLLIFAPKYPNPPDLPPEFKKARVVYVTSVPTHFPNLRVNLPSFPKIRAEIKSFNPSIIYAQAPTITSIEAQQYARIRSIPFVGSFHTLYASDAYLKIIFKTEYATMFQPLIWSILRWFYNASDRIIV
ncbi:MAG: glycosyltransferase, partial [Candidatus Roizmanbacteria bacterium]|nr:glycosyltransferase [Candidatus Roizmanbacteria bacterium]